MRSRANHRLPVAVTRRTSCPASRASLRPFGGTDVVLKLAGLAGAVVGEVSDGVLELRTPICSRTAEAVDALADLRRELQATVGVIGAGVHPIGRFGDVRLRSALRPIREVACHAVALAGAYAADRGCWEELVLIHRLLETGNGAIRQRRHAEEGGVTLMLQRLADETAGRESLEARCSPEPAPTVTSNGPGVRPDWSPVASARAAIG
jgi:gamma-glutamyl:cysteine ligase YbdK (ATP-grasp superfamily)